MAISMGDENLGEKAVSLDSIVLFADTDQNPFPNSDSEEGFHFPRSKNKLTPITLIDNSMEKFQCETRHSFASKIRWMRCLNGSIPGAKNMMTELGPRYELMDGPEILPQHSLQQWIEKTEGVSKLSYFADRAQTRAPLRLTGKIFG